MKKLLAVVTLIALSVGLPFIAQAAPQAYQGMMSGATVKIDNNGTIQTIMEKNASNTSNMSLAFDNMSGIVSKGQMSFNGMWIGFGGTALTPTPKMLQGNLQCGGAITLDGTVSYNVATNTYTGSGDVIEFIGTMSLGGVMKEGWIGQYGTPDAGPGGGWMPGWGGGTGQGSGMPGWGGSVSNWGMMGGYGTVSPSPSGGTSYMAPGGGMMGNGGPGGGIMGVASNGGTPNSSSIPVNGRVGTLKMYIAPTTAAIIHVTDNIPDHSNPTPVSLSITLPVMRLNMGP